MKELGLRVNLIICQKSKIDDWIEHFRMYYSYIPQFTYDLTKRPQFDEFLEHVATMDNDVEDCFGVINYELAFRRPELLELTDFTLMLDESSMIQNETAKRSKFVLKMKPRNVILLSGTPTGGKYEKLYSQSKLLGWDISKRLYYKEFIITEWNDYLPVPMVVGYKNVDRLKSKLREHGAIFMKSEDVFDLPKQIDTNVFVKSSAKYRKFRKDKIIRFQCDNGDVELVGDTTLTKMLYERQLCGMYSDEKISAFSDLIESTDDRIIVFYNFRLERDILSDIVLSKGRMMSFIDGETKQLDSYNECDSSITFVQYQAGAMGLNLQKANKIIYFTPPLSSELFEQSKKRIHRIGQTKSCFYYYMTVKGSVEQRIYNALSMRHDFTERLFEGD